MKVALVCPYATDVPGGVQRVVLDLADVLERRGHETTVVGPREDGSGGIGGTVTIAGNSSRAPIALSPGTVRRVAHAVSGADLVHVHEPVMPLVSLSALFQKRPLVATFHADPPRWAMALYAAAGRALASVFRRAVVTAVSDVAARAVPSSWGSVEIIPNGVDVEAFRVDVARHRHRVVFVGRDEPRKGLDVVLDVWPSVVAAVPDADLIVVGAERHRKITGVTFRGRLPEDEKRRILASAGVFAAPNLGGESFGVILVEAMAAGCRVIASDIEPFRAVGGDVAAYARPDDAAAWAETLIASLTDDADRADLTERGVRRARTYDWERVAERYEAVYRRAQRIA